MGYGLWLRIFSWSPATLAQENIPSRVFPANKTEEIALISTLVNLYGSLPH